MVWRLVDEEGLVILNPLVGIFLTEMPVNLCQLADEVICA